MLALAGSALYNAKRWRRAIKIGRYLVPHAQAAYAEDRVGSTVASSAAGRRLDPSESIFAELTFREIQQGLKGSFEKVAMSRPVVALLVEYGYLRERVVPERPGAGRKPSTIYAVNLHVHAQNAQNSGNAWAPPTWSPDKTESVLTIPRMLRIRGASWRKATSSPNPGIGKF